MDPAKKKLLFETAEKLFSAKTEAMEEFCAKDLIVLGTSIDEVVYSLKGFQNYRKRMKETKNDVKRKTNHKLVFHKIMSGGDGALFLYEIRSHYVSADIETTVFQRVTMGLVFENNKWKIVHVHFAKIDEDQEEDDPYHFSEVKRKNQELQILVNQKTADLEEKNKELQIETSLERVRTVSMSMKKPGDLLEICESLFKELHKLGFKELRNSMINIFNDEDETFLNYDYSDVIGKSITPLTYDIHPVIRKQVRTVRKKKDSFSETIFTIKDLADWKKFRKNRGEKNDPRLNKSKALHYYFYSIGTAAIGISTFSSITNEKKIILKRFRNVFDFAYRRFMDVSQAEAQAREAQIEAALERVRSRTMAMQKSDELSDAAILLFRQIQSLGITTGSCGFNIWDNDKQAAKVWMSSHDGALQEPFVLPHLKSKLYKEVYEASERGDEIFVKEVKGRELEKHFDFLRTIPVIKDVIGKLDKARFKYPEKLVYNIIFFKQGYLSFHLNESIPEHIEIFKRFAGVFEQTYTRFLDLQKAEAQAKEAMIEASLERIRARSMAMHHSKELVDASIVLFNELKSLGIDAVRTGVAIVDSANKTLEIWSSQLIEEKRNKILGVVPFNSHPFFEGYFRAWKKKKQFFSYEISGKEVKKYYDTMSTVLSYPKTKKFNPKELFYTFFFPEGSLNVVSQKDLTKDECSLMVRFANVFGLIYRRFLDLQKAEAQAREAQIEAALERVRSRTMGMQKSEELKEVIQLVNDQLVHLNINVEHSGFVMDYKVRDDHDLWITDRLGSPTKLTIPYFDCEYYNRFKEAKEKGEDFFAMNLTFDEKNRFYKKLIEIVPGIPEESKTFLFSCPGLGISTVLLENVGLYIENFSGVSFSDEDNKTLMRFGKVFQQTYTRFLDLQKAEGQTREAQIEAALEKVRGRAMAMHNSNDLTSAAGMLFTELNNLGIKPIRSGFVLLSKKSRIAKLYPATSFDNKNTISFTGEFEFTGHPVYEKQYESWKEKKNYFPVLEGDVLKSYYKILAKGLSVPYKNFPTNKKQFGTFLPFTEGFLFTWSDEPYTDKEINILERFKSILDLTIRRYLDLKNAEEQAREAKIEAGLERTRTQSMLMQHSDELDDTLRVFHEQILLLGIPSEFSFLWLPDEEKERHIFWAAWAEENMTIFKSKAVNYPLDKSEPATAQCFADWKSDEAVHSYSISPDGVENYFATWSALFTGIEQFKPENYKDGVSYVEAFMKYGCFGVMVKNELSQDDKKILLRFSVEFERTYTRFLDLQKAEAQAREARIETSLEKVRARALAMQQPEELIEVAQVLRYEMGSLGVEELETCSIYINEETLQRSECWYAIKDLRSNEKKLISDHFELDYNDTEVGRNMLKFYHSDEKKISIVMRGEARKEWIKYCERKSGILKGYYGEVIPDRTYHLYKFSHGSIGVASAGSISEESWNLLSRVASVFTLAYSRFKDLTQSRFDLLRLREEKQRAEEALTELKSAQSQLIQSEKMASLGELTAGIAHEIQNPLNFVNNFSEVNTELVDELNQEIEKGNFDEVIAIAKDIKENENKIKHHGKRAEAIVKGMLQHSRASGGQKEFVNINMLADEYLRLAYHGLRAKDKTFNAKMETDFDENMGTVEVVPQDIGRVILNLITNAFYAVTEKKKLNPEARLPDGQGYEPTVKVSTKRVDDKIEIKVKDNGNGIPEKVLDKIFQPFFTTKPAGQGTGLGLSLSYDIIKAHNGELKVETKEGEGSEFVIELTEVKKTNGR